MTRLVGPMLSMDASKAFAGLVVYSKWKGRNYARLLVTPYNPKSDYQVGIRETMTMGVLYFTKGAYIAAAQKTWWNTYGEATSPAISGINRFISKFVELNYDGDTGTFMYAGIPSPS